MYASYSKLSKELKNGTEILVGQVVFKLWIKTVKIIFWSILKNPLPYLNFSVIFEFLGQFTIRCIYFVQKGVDNFEIEYKTCLFLVRGAVPP